MPALSASPKTSFAATWTYPLLGAIDHRCSIVPSLLVRISSPAPARTTTPIILTVAAIPAACHADYIEHLCHKEPLQLWYHIQRTHKEGPLTRTTDAVSTAEPLEWWRTTSHVSRNSQGQKRRNQQKSHHATTPGQRVFEQETKKWLAADRIEASICFSLDATLANVL